MFHSDGKRMNVQTTATLHCPWQPNLHLALPSLEAHGSQNSSSTCMRAVPVLPKRTAVVIKEVLIQEEEFWIRIFVLFVCLTVTKRSHKRLIPFRNDGPSTRVLFILLWQLVLWQERLPRAHLSSCCVNSSDCLKPPQRNWDERNSSSAGKGCRPRLSRATQPLCGGLRFPTSLGCAHPPKVSRKRPRKKCRCETWSVLDLFFPSGALRWMPLPRGQFTEAGKGFLSRIWRPCSSPRPLLLTGVPNHWSPVEAWLLCLGSGSSSKPISSEGNKEPLLTSPSLRLSQEFPRAGSPPSRPLCLPGKNRSAGDAHTPPYFFFLFIHWHGFSNHPLLWERPHMILVFIYFLFSDTDLE